MTHPGVSAAPFIPGESRIHQISLSPTEIPPAKYGGSELIVSNLSRGLRDLEQQVIVYAPGSCGIVGVEHFQTLPEPAPLHDADGKIQPNVPAHIEGILQGLSQNTAPGDIVHFNHFQQAGQIQSSLPPGLNTFETGHWIRVGSTPIIYPSFSLRGRIDKPGLVVPHGIDTDLFTPVSNGKEETSCLFYAGQLIEEKGLEIADQLADETGHELKLAGPEPKTDFGRHLAAKHIYLGELSASQLAKEYSAAKALIFPTQYTETFGLVPVEAMACGCPVITTGLGGTGETVIHGKTGFFAEDLRQFKDALGKIEFISRQDCVKHAQNYSIEKMAKKVLEAYCLFYG